MKTSKSMIAIIALAIIATTVAVVSCKKEQASETPKQSKNTLAQILDFKHQLEAVGLNPHERTVSYMSIPDAVWNLEALFNYTYAYPGYSYGQTVCCDTTLYLPVCTNDSVSLAELYVFNFQIYDAVLALYQAALLDDKQFVILDVEAGERNGSLQAIELHTVQGSLDKGTPPLPSPPQNGPFEPGVSWYYGENHANSLNNPIDAADTLSGLLNAWLVPKAPEGCEYVYLYVKTKQTHLGENYPNSIPGFPDVSPRYCEFFMENPTAQDYWLNSDQMNYYYFGERHLVLDILPNDANDPVPSEHSLFQIIVDDHKTFIEEICTSIEHHTTAIYGYQLLASQDSIYKENFQ